ncbi:MAG: hypothetical protein AB7I51_12120, partial [Methylocystis sp.]
DSGAGSICKQTASRAAKTCGNDYFRRSQNFVTSTPCEFFTDDFAILYARQNAEDYVAFCARHGATPALP